MKCVLSLFLMCGLYSRLNAASVSDEDHRLLSHRLIFTSDKYSYNAKWDFTPYSFHIPHAFFTQEKKVAALERLLQSFAVQDAAPWFYVKEVPRQTGRSDIELGVRGSHFVRKIAHFLSIHMADVEPKIYEHNLSYPDEAQRLWCLDNIQTLQEAAGVTRISRSKLPVHAEAPGVTRISLSELPVHAEAPVVLSESSRRPCVIL